mmetsp:Transcript_8877/g.16477  ORF Transcript_8877/g.16477 Transcript_8877/m.16477 type:complete len:160 (+) Transcript_8877:305-784(+)
MHALLGQLMLFRSDEKTRPESSETPWPQAFIERSTYPAPRPRSPQPPPLASSARRGPAAWQVASGELRLEARALVAPRGGLTAGAGRRPEGCVLVLLRSEQLQDELLPAAAPLSQHCRCYRHCQTLWKTDKWSLGLYFWSQLPRARCHAAQLVGELTQP